MMIPVNLCEIHRLVLARPGVDLQVRRRIQVVGGGAPCQFLLNLVGGRMKFPDLLGFQPLFCREGFITVLKYFVLVRHIRLVVALTQFGPRLALKRVHTVLGNLILTYRPGLGIKILG